MINFEDARPVRSFPTWPHKRSYEGWWWTATTSRHIGYESWLERDHLMLFDHDPAVTGIASQPFWILFPAGLDDLNTSGAIGSGGERLTPEQRHAPDYFLRLRDGTAVVADIRPSTRLDAATCMLFERTRTLCLRLGWQYRVLGELDPTVVQNIRWLAGYRHPRFGTDEQVTAALLGVFGTARPLREGLDACGGGLRQRAVMYHLLWRQHLLYDRHLPLDDASVLSCTDTTTDPPADQTLHTPGRNVSDSPRGR